MGPLSAIGLLLLVVTVLLFMGLGALLVHALVTGHRLRALVVTLVGVGWSGLYLVGVVAASLGSKERVLDLGEIHHFCGAYLDCHAIVSVVDVDTTTAIGNGADALTTQGVFYVVTLLRSSDAQRARIRLDRPTAVVVDGAGNRFRRSAEGEAALAAAEGTQQPLGLAVAPQERYTTKVVFDLPLDVTAPKLRVFETGWMTRLSELFLIGDEDGFLHRRTFFRLPLAGEAQEATAIGAHRN